MGKKYHIRSGDLPELFSLIDMTCLNNYHDIYGRIGLTRGSNGNFHCPNAATSHMAGTDNVASLSIDNATGQFKCFSCGIHGNLNSYVKEQLGEESYTDFMIDFLNLQGQVGFQKKMSDAEYDKSIEDMRKLSQEFSTHWEKKNGKPFVLSDESLKAIKDETIISMKFIDDAVAVLLNDPLKMEYLNKWYGGIDAEFVKKYKIGFQHSEKEEGWYLFPQFDESGNLVNVKGYNPFTEDRKFKWKYIFKGKITKPVPFDSLKNNVITFLEGEPDMYAALSLGIPGAFTLGPCGKAETIEKIFGGIEGLKRTFANKDIDICLDADKPGRAAANKLARSLYPYTKKIKIIDLDKHGLNPKALNSEGKRTEKDFRDLVKNLKIDKAAWEKIVSNTEYYTENKKEKLSGRDIADLYKDNQQNIIYYNGVFYLWDGQCYLEIPDYILDGRIMKFIQDSLDNKYAMVKFVKETVANMKGLCLHENLKINSFISGDQPEGNYLALQNGILSLDSITDETIASVLCGPSDPILLQPTPDFFNLTCLPFNYDKIQPCPLWRKFLDAILPDQQVQDLLQEWFGFNLSTNLNFEMFMIFVGEGANGKSVAAKILRAMLGYANVSTVPLESFDKPFNRYEMFGKIANICTEMGDVDKISEEQLKAIVSCDSVQFERKFGEPFSAIPTVKLTFATNVLPPIRDRSSGIWRRMALIPFSITIPEDQQDKELAAKIIADELPGVFNWALEGLKRLKKRGRFELPSICSAARQEYQLETNSARRFLEEECEADFHSEISTKELYRLYDDFCQSAGAKAFGDVQFGKEVKKVFPGVIKVGRGTGKGKVYSGVKLVTDNARKDMNELWHYYDDRL